MKISANWLSDYVSHGMSSDELAEALTMVGLEVEEVEPVGSSFEGVVVGHVVDVRKHPNAERLTVCAVDVGSGEPLSIVCGAPNVAAGQKVPVATVGTTLQLPSRDNPGVREPVVLSKARIRGESSHGMICAEDELGLSDDHSGIMVLDSNAIAGTPFEKYLDERGLEARDVAIDVAITPNRPDAICHLGIARDVSAVRKAPLHVPEPKVPNADLAAAEAFSVRIDAPDGCPRYVGMLVRNVAIGDSPAWMQQRLRTIGLRPRNNVVDITNYVMYELGQPLHAFDFDQLAGAQIVVRKTDAPTTFTTLDSKKRELPAGTLMIADAERDIAVAGVMGGENSEVTDATTNVLIESAYFDPVQIRRTARALQIQTDASYRFERGVDPDGQARAAARAAELMVEFASGTLVEGIVDANPIPFQARTESLRPSRVNTVLGTDVPTDTIADLLRRIGFSVKDAGDDRLECGIPSYRPDVEREIDVIEEIARLVGYEGIPEPSRSLVPNHTVRIAADRRFREQARDLLVGLGFREVVTNSLLSREWAESFQDRALPGERFGGDLVETLNPVSLEMAVLRPSLLPGVLRVAGHNANRGRRSLKYFEFGNVQMRVQTARSSVEGYTETECLLILASGEHSPETWDSHARDEDLFDLKGVAESLLSAIRVPEIRFVPLAKPSAVLHSGLSILSGATEIGTLGQLQASAAAAADLRGTVYFVEFDWKTVSELAEPNIRRQYAPFSRHPVVERDIAVTAERSVPVGHLQECVRSAGGSLLRSVRVFDLYEGDQIEVDRKSVAFALTFGSERTLRDEEVDARVAEIVSALADKHGAILRQ